MNKNVDKPVEREVFLCRCEEVTEKEVLQAIEEGARTLKGVKKRTHAGMGLCQGRTCSRLITGKLAQQMPVEEILPDTQRPPVRTVKLSEFIEGDEDSC